jgi:hypothetical protein
MSVRFKDKLQPYREELGKLIVLSWPPLLGDDLCTHQPLHFSWYTLFLQDSTSSTNIENQLRSPTSIIRFTHRLHVPTSSQVNLKYNNRSAPFDICWVFLGLSWTRFLLYRRQIPLIVARGRLILLPSFTVLERPYANHVNRLIDLEVSKELWNFGLMDSTHDWE